MLALIPILLLLITSITIVVIRLTRFRFSYYWLLAASGTLLAWPLVLIAQLWIPIQLPILSWQPKEAFLASPVLLLDNLSWPFALALATLTLTVTLTDVTHPIQEDQPRSSWSDMAGWLAISAIGLLAIMAGNLLTLLISWTALDLMQTITWLIKARGKVPEQKIVIGFAVRLASLFLVIWAGILLYTSNQPSSWKGITPQASIYLFLAALIRMGVMPYSSPIPDELLLSRSTRTLFSLAPVAASLVLVSRIAAVSIPSISSSLLLVLTGVSAIFSSLSWAKAKGEIDGQPYWISGVAALALASALRNQITASMAWGIAIMLSGGLLFCLSLRHRWLLALPLIGTFFFSSLPLTPTWPGVFLYIAPFHPITSLLLISQGILLGGYLRHSLRPSSTSISGERWIWLILPWSLVLLPLIHAAIAWWSLASIPTEYSSDSVSLSIPTWIQSWPGFVAVILVGLSFLWPQRGHRIPPRLIKVMKSGLSFLWLYRFLIIAYHFLMGLFFRVNILLEGKAGILWAMLVLILLLSLFGKAALGG